MTLASTKPTKQKGKTIVAPDKGILRTSTHFTDGVVCGYLMYFDDHAGTGMKDTDFFPLLKDALCDTRYPDSWLAGYVVGFCEAVIKDRDIFGVVSSSN